ncbi:alpha/beta-hydrolase [Aspergillus sclerotioniger CBS 115572]|uniref:Alpha/beta-hydrolase n=1 Tax=Aspergillus sclerotioniger CBS 115572 TaxID=1450535 RepID=A0A317VAN8_9EURO|nr:alpha/beta-hydrolase [Aspergillus sclerotioniger CBS 115572]PWY68980.1 alpha/beta-hydrolase [Aspergillus sclerotioniger CBS 115572]
MSRLSSTYSRVAVFLVRALAKHRGRIASNPDEVLYIKSRDCHRSIKVHIYQPLAKLPEKPSPVLINFHGSGFVIPFHGSDDAFCCQISNQTCYTVLDVQYRLAPEHPFPAAINDAEDIVNWVLGRPTEFDISRVAISGFSAGGNIALATASTIFPKQTFSSVLAFYPIVEAFVDPDALVAPDPNGRPIPSFIMRLFTQCYVPPGFDPRDPRISPGRANLDCFPQRVMIITAACDSLAVEAENLAARLRDSSGRKVVCERMKKCNHAWDKAVRPRTYEREATEHVYALAKAMLES